HERDQATAHRPADAIDEFLLGDQCFRRGELPQASRHFDEALRFEPNHFWARYYLAICALKANRPGEAKAGLTACLGQRPAFGWLYIHRGFAEGELGQFEEAENDLKRAFAYDLGVEGRYSIHVIRGVGRVRRGNYAEAVADLEAAVALLPDQSEAYVNLAQAFRGLGRFDDALAQLGKANRLRPQQALPYRNRADLFQKLGDHGAALRDYDQALRFEPPGSPYLVQVHLERARILQAAKKYPEAIQACDAALAKTPD